MSSLLDELEREAERQRNKSAQDGASLEEREAHWQQALQPAAQRLGEYLQRLAKTLTAAERRVRLTYAIAGYGEVVAYAEGPFECRLTPGAAQHEVDFSMVAQVATGDSALVIAETPGKVRLVQGLLQAHHLSGLHDVTKNERGEVVSGRFQARGRIPVRVHALASRDSGQLRMTLSNVEAFGTAQRVFGAAALTNETFDALGRYLLREASSFSRETVDADVRKQLQSQIQRDQVRREWETRLAVQLGEDEARVLAMMSPAASPAALLRRIRNVLTRDLRRRS